MKGWKLWLVIIAVVVVVVFVAYQTVRQTAETVRPVVERSTAVADKARCISNVKNLALAAQMWSWDHGGRLPNAATWADDFKSYLPDRADVLKCAGDQSGARCSYAMNAALSGKVLEDIADPESTVLFYETARPGDNPSGGPDDVVTPARHNGGNNYGFAKGTASWETTKPSFGAQ
jgi:hypothetical protein